jgi:hypothetical protein
VRARGAVPSRGAKLEGGAATGVPHHAAPEVDQLPAGVLPRAGERCAVPEPGC